MKAGTIRYHDGVTLKVTRLRNQRVTGQGVGVVDGPVTLVEFAFHNGSNRVIDLNQVVVSAAFGSPARSASPTYVDGTRDFAGDVRPGRTVTARYGFSIPTAELSHVTLHVDFDAIHAAAQFSGSARR